MDKKNSKILDLIKTSEYLYTCCKCNKIPKIKKIDYINNEIELSCEEHSTSKIKINEYLNTISKLKKCQKCLKESANLNRPLKYCSSCDLILCNNCALNHTNPNHNLFNNEEFNTTCKKHLNNLYEAYCSNCRINICKECKKSGLHLKHNKFDFIEIQLNNNELEIIYNFDKNLERQINELDYNKFIESLEKEKDEKQKLIISDFQKQKDDIDKKYNDKFQFFMIKLNKDKNQEISELNKKIEILKLKLNKEIKKKMEEFENNKKNLEKSKEVIEIHNILINSYKKHGEHNLNYSENIKNVIESIKAFNEIKKQKTIDFNIENVIKKYEIYIDKKLQSLKANNNNINSDILNNILKSKIIEFKQINISSENIKSLDFLKNNCEELECLLMTNCPVKDISIISNINFSSLIELKISNAKIKDINALANGHLENIKKLNLDRNEITDINSLQKIRFAIVLEELYLSGNKINNISVFNYISFPKLKILFLSYNLIQNISSIKQILINSCLILSLDHNQISDISLFKDINSFECLKQLSINNNKIDLSNEINKAIINSIKMKIENFQY